MNSTHNEGKAVVAERFRKILNKKNSKSMTYLSKNVHIDNIDDTVNNYNKTYHKAIKMKPVDARSSMYIDSVKGNKRNKGRS